MKIIRSNKCAKCSTLNTAYYSQYFGMTLCDDCFTDMNDAREDEIRKIREALYAEWKEEAEQ